MVHGDDKVNLIKDMCRNLNHKVESLQCQSKVSMWVLGKEAVWKFILWVSAGCVCLKIDDNPRNSYNWMVNPNNASRSADPSECVECGRCERKCTQNYWNTENAKAKIRIVYWDLWKTKNLKIEIAAVVQRTPSQWQKNAYSVIARSPDESGRRSNLGFSEISLK